MMEKQKFAALCAALCCLSLPLSACGDVALDSTVERCQNALTAAQGQESIAFTERWTLENDDGTTVLADMTISKAGDNWTRTQKDADNTSELEYDGTQYQKTDDADWAPAALTAYESFWTTLSLDDFCISEAAEEDGIITLTVESEAAEDSDGGSSQLLELEFELNEDGSLRACREVLRLTGLDTEETLTGTLTVEITVSEDDGETISSELEDIYEDASAEYISLLPTGEDAENG